MRRQPGMPPVRLTRRVAFSSGHRYWMPHLSEVENRELFGPWASPYSHGHNYVLDVTVQGLVDPVTGMVVNIKRIDDVLKDRIVSRMDGRSLNDEVPPYDRTPPTLENILLVLWDTLSADGSLPEEATLSSLRLEEMPTLFGELKRDGAQSLMTLTRIYEFAASHRLHCPDLSQAENDELFGKCNNPAGHGHNYVLEVTVEGEPDPRTGMMVDLSALDDAVERHVVGRYDHRNLNEDLLEFRGRNTTSEVVATEIFRTLDGNLPARLHRVRLHETARNIFEVGR
jgi:6-pyruvoyltetrahydropterin/6-carboxytetrahydropterin synthase